MWRRAQQMAALEARADIDPLTDLPNRRALRARARPLARLCEAPRHRAPRCSISISTISSASTTATGMPPATRCCARWRACSAGTCAPPTWWRGSAATNSRCCCGTATRRNARTKALALEAAIAPHHRDARRRGARGRRLGRRRHAAAARPAGGDARSAPTAPCMRARPRSARRLVARRPARHLSAPGTMCHIRSDAGDRLSEGQTLSVRWRILMLKQHHVRRLALLAAAGSLVVGSLWRSCRPAQDPAADYPNRPVRIIVSNPAGGGIDTVTRIVADRLQSEARSAGRDREPRRRRRQYRRRGGLHRGARRLHAARLGAGGAHDQHLSCTRSSTSIRPSSSRWRCSAPSRTRCW